MISQIVDPRFMRDRVVDLGRVLKRRSERFANAGADVHAEAEKAGVTGQDIEAAREAVSHIAKSSRFARAEGEAAWLPRDPELGIVQSALEEFYRKAGAVNEPVVKSSVLPSIQ
jgi:hypothetical protein